MSNGGLERYSFLSGEGVRKLQFGIGGGYLDWNGTRFSARNARDRAYVGFRVGTPSDPNDAATKAYVDASGGGGGGGGVSAPRTEAGDYTLILGDAEQTKIFRDSGRQLVTIPPEASVDFPLGTRIRCVRGGSGLVRVVPDSGVTLRLPRAIRPPVDMGALVGLRGDLAAQNFTTSTPIRFDAETYDFGFHDNAVNNTRLTVPSGFGITKVNLWGMFGFSAFTANTFVTRRFLKNGSSAYPGFGMLRHDSPNSVVESQARALGVPCTEGDYFEYVLATESDTSVTLVAAETYMRVRVAEIQPQGNILYQWGEVRLLKIGPDEWMLRGPALG